MEPTWMRKRDKTRTSTGNGARNIKATRTGKRETERAAWRKNLHRSTGHARDDIKDPSGRGRQRWNGRQEDGRDGKTKSTRRLQSTGNATHGTSKTVKLQPDSVWRHGAATTRDSSQRCRAACKNTHRQCVCAWYSPLNSLNRCAFILH